jgi:hypothetical protein
VPLTNNETDKANAETDKAKAEAEAATSCAQGRSRPPKQLNGTCAGPISGQ